MSFYLDKQKDTNKYNKDNLKYLKDENASSSTATEPKEQQHPHKDDKAHDDNDVLQPAQQEEMSDCFIIQIYDLCYLEVAPLGTFILQNLSKTYRL